MIVSSRSRMLRAALSVKVKHKILLGLVSVCRIIFATRKLSSWVLPVPGPATTSIGPSILSTARFWAVFNLLYSLLKDIIYILTVIHSQDLLIERLALML